MPIPDYRDIMLPLLTLAADGEEHYLPQARDVLADQLVVSGDERRKTLPSRNQAVFDNRVGWAKSYLKHAGLIENLKRGYFRITERGLAALEQKPKKINSAFLSQYPEFQAFRQRSRKTPIPTHDETGNCDDDATPDEAMDNAYQTLRSQLSQELLEQVKSCSPAFFERMVVDLLLQMGYGGSRIDAGSAIGGSGDGGIDGIIKEDKLGLEVVYIQAKRWEDTVGRPEIQKFAGALQGHRAKKGVFITTSSFTRDAKDYASMIDTRIVLVDGDLLAELMIDHNVGVSPKSTYEIKRMDSDYFIED